MSITDNAMLTKRDIDSTTVHGKETSVNVSFTKETSTNIDHTFLTNNEKLDYLIGECYIKV